MKCSVKVLSKGFPVDTLLFFVPKDNSLLKKDGWNTLHTGILKLLKDVQKAGDFEGNAGEVCVYPAFSQLGEGVKKVVFVGLGDIKKKDLLLRIRSCMGRMAAQLPAKHITRLGIWLDGYVWEDDFTKVGDDLAAHAHLGAYRFLNYKTKDKSSLKVMEEVVLVTADKSIAKQLTKGVTRANTVNQYVAMARDLSNESPNVAGPAYIEEKARTVAKALGMKVKVLDTATVKKKGMNLLYNVGKAAQEGPRLVVLSYRGNPANKDVYAMVGKGITYDTGGLSLKPSAYMRTMKVDMTGASTVFGTIAAVAALGLKVNVDAYLPLAENAISEASYRPDDILTAYNGMTVEIDNTDAEGRLVMADALTYASESKPAQIIDVATLTGAALFVTGGMAAPFMGIDEDLVTQLKTASTETGDRLWELPLWEEANGYLKSNVADILNCYAGGRSHPGTISAGAFLRHFVGEGIAWAHIDIAGVTLAEEAVNCYTTGASGFGVRLLTKWLENKA